MDEKKEQVNEYIINIFCSNQFISSSFLYNRQLLFKPMGVGGRGDVRVRDSSAWGKIVLRRKRERKGWMSGDEIKEEKWDLKGWVCLRARR